MANNGSTPFYRSGTFWSLVIAAIGQIVEAALAPGAGAQRFMASDTLVPELTQAIAPALPAISTAGGIMTWVGLAGAFWRRWVAQKPLRF